MIYQPPPERPPFNDALYQALQRYPQHSLDHYSRKPLNEIGARMILGVKEPKSTIPKSFNPKKVGSKDY